MPELQKLKEQYIQMAPTLIKNLRNKREKNMKLVDTENQKYNDLYATWQKKIERWEKNPKKQ